MTRDKGIINDLKPKGVTKFIIGHGCYIPAIGMETIRIKTQSGTKKFPMFFTFQIWIKTF